jgi:two-component system, OmpR family, KDP operon response regulator KdpE
MSESAPRLLIVEDEVDIRRFVRLALEHEGIEVYEADSVKRAIVEAGTRRPDLVVLDLGLPDRDGVEFIRDLRSWSDIPVIVLSARTGESDKINALDAGADDYLTKPFGSGELLARVRAHLRRRSRDSTSTSPRVSFGDVTIDLTRRTIERGGEALHLTPIEFRLLAHLVTHPDCVITQSQLLKAVWGPLHVEDAHYLRVYMAQLRRKLELDPTCPRHLVTEVGVGYRFVP